MGMRTRTSALRSRSSGRPAPSLPTRSATGWHQSTSQGAKSGGAASLDWDALKRAPTASAPWTVEARVCTPASLSCMRRIASDMPASMGKWSAAPADARSALGENGLAVPLWPEAQVAAPVAPKAAAVRRIVPTLPGSCTPTRMTRRAAFFVPALNRSSSEAAVRGSTSAATPWGCSVSARPSKSRSVVRKTGNPSSARSTREASLARWRSPDSLKSTASMRQVERNASSTRRTPSTPTLPDSVGSPPRRAMRKSLSQRLSLLVSTEGVSGTRWGPRRGRAAWFGGAMTGKPSKAQGGWQSALPCAACGPVVASRRCGPPRRSGVQDVSTAAPKAKKLPAELLRVNPQAPEVELVRYAAHYLMRGCVVGIPTDTLYGLAADPFNLAAVDEIYRVKGRPETRALPILVNSLDQAILLSL